MSSTEAVDPGEAEAGAADDQAYFRALEEHLLQLRGKTTLLSPADWQVAAEWRRRGIPLEIVAAVMSELVAKQRERRSKRGVSSLRYFRAAVEAAWEEQLELGAGGVAPRYDPGPPVEERLRALSRALPVTLTVAEPVRAELLALSGPMEEVEATLVEIDRRLLALVEESIGSEARSKLDERVAAATRPFAADLPADELALLRERFRAQALREAARLPLLSLFAPAALAPSEAEAGSSSRAPVSRDPSDG